MKSLINKISIHTLSQLLPIEILFAIFWDVALFSKYSDKSNLFIVITGTIIINVMLIANIYIFLFIYHCKINIYNAIESNIGIFVILAIFLLCYLTVIDAWLNLDGYLYYTDIRKIKNWNFSNFSELMLAGHYSQGYTIFLMIGEFLFPNNVLGVRIMQFILCSITIYCFYKIVKYIISGIDEIEASLYTAIFAMSPMLLGMSAEINTDFPLICFFVWMFYIGLKEYYILQAFCALLLCFSKETGCLLFGFYLIGILLCRLIVWCKQKTKTSLTTIFSYDIILLIGSGCIWIANFLYNKERGWMNTVNSSSQVTKSTSLGVKLNSPGFFPEYIIQKILQMLFINFHWILYALILFLITDTIIEGNKNVSNMIKMKAEHIFALLLSFIAFLLYNFFYITYNHYRYLIPFLFFICFTAIIAICIIFKHRLLRLIVTSGITILFTLSNFITIDPISQLLFLKEGTGIGNILIPCTIISDSDNNAVIKDKENYSSVIINTSGIYNFQYAYLGKCFDKTLKSIGYDEKMLIVMPEEYRDEWGTMASIFGINLAGINDFYWDTEQKQTNINCGEQIFNMEQNSKYQKINLKIVNSLDSITTEIRKQYNKIYYIALPFKPNFNHKSFLANEKIISKKTIQYISWKWNIYELK